MDRTITNHRAARSILEKGRHGHGPHELGTNWARTGHELGTNRTRTGHEPDTNRTRTGHELGPRTVCATPPANESFRRRRETDPALRSLWPKRPAGLKQVAMPADLVGKRLVAPLRG